MNKSRVNFRQNVWSELKKRGWDQSDLAVAAGYSLSGIRKTMGGQRFSSEAVEAIAGALKTTAAALMSDPKEFQELVAQRPENKKLAELTVEEFQEVVKATSEPKQGVVTTERLIEQSPEGDLLREIVGKLSLASLNQLKVIRSAVDSALDTTDVVLESDGLDGKEPSAR